MSKRVCSKTEAQRLNPNSFMHSFKLSVYRYSEEQLSRGQKENQSGNDEVGKVNAMGSTDFNSRYTAALSCLEARMSKTLHCTEIMQPDRT